VTNKERLMRTLNGQPVDRPPVSFYELGGYHQDPHDTHEYNIYSHPSWHDLLTLARTRTDKIVINSPRFTENEKDYPVISTQEVIGDSIHYITEITTPRGVITKRARRDKDIDTGWTLEHFLKNADDARAYLSLPEDEICDIDISQVLKCEEDIGTTGIASIDIGDAICVCAELFSMEDYLVFALTERELFLKLLERAHRKILKRVQMTAKALPGRLYRICGPEYASPPYLPPSLFREYVVPFDTELIGEIHKSGGFARVHSHGNLADIIGDIAAMGADGLDPIEPPPQGDVSLKFVREKYGEQLVLFGNIELVEIETLPEDVFRERVKQALSDGMYGQGRGFVLMPSASPISRQLPTLAYRNYLTMVELAERAWY